MRAQAEAELIHAETMLSEAVAAEQATEHPAEPMRRFRVAVGPDQQAVADHVRRLALLDINSNLGDGLSPDELRTVRQALQVPAMSLNAGTWDPDTVVGGQNRAGAAFALMVVDGILLRNLVIGERSSSEILGPGDILRPTSVPHQALPVKVSLTATTRVTIAVLDNRVLAVMRQWPRLVGNFFELMLAHSDRASATNAVAQLPRVEDRLLAIFWHLADRFGRMRSDGAIVAVELTHEQIGSLIGARRPTVSLGMKALAEQGLLTRVQDGWLLAPQSAELIAQPPRKD